MAIDKINATALLDGGVSTADLADGAVTAAKLDAAAVTPMAVSDTETHLLVDLLFQLVQLHNAQAVQIQVNLE